jgi:hypothetical protein
MERIRQKQLLYKVPIFNTDIIFVYFESYKYANKVLEKYGLETKIEDCQGVAGYEELDEKRYFYLAIKHGEDRKVDEGTLVHEIHHLTQDILEYVDIKFQKGKNNEAYSHLQEWLYNIFKKHIQ